MRTPDQQRSRASVRALAALLFAACAALAAAAPYVPADDATVLERVPARSELERLSPLRAAVAARPTDLEAALALATGYINIGRHDSDPRFIAYAQSALLPWLAQPSPPERALVLQATTLQYLHQFDAALALLERALSREPLDAQAWLTRASLLELRGDYAEAHRACARLVRSADEFTALTCLASVAGRNGHLAASYAALGASGEVDPRLPGPLRAWRLTVLAEMAERLGDDRTAEAHLREALRAAGEDPYVKAACADLLLRTGRPWDVLVLLAGNESQDPLLLRLAIAAHRLGSSPQSGHWAQLYEERLRAAERDRDYTHQREQALYLLDVREDPRAAVEVARRNWVTQREPADVRVYARAAARARAAEDTAALARWLAHSHYEDRALETLSDPAMPGAAQVRR
ncbi:MAG TPA: tetratricopeptide repeat protein [Steroidobacteraceae bacterium]|nr:tetratricopeptide repeat protein [Steroidobacteraceae bacterium]